MADDYQELDVFGRPKSKVEGVPYVLSGADPGAEDAALADYASGLRNEELPGFVHNYIPGSAASEWERQNPIRLFPGLDRTPIELADWDTIKNRIFGPRQGQTVNTLGRSVRMPARATFNERFGLEPTERVQTWPEKMLRSGVALPVDVMEGRVRADFSRPGDFSDDPNALNPLAPLIERTQDLAGLAAGGSLATGAKPELPSKLSNALGKGYTAAKRVISTLSDDELGTAISGLQNQKYKEPGPAANGNAQIPGPVPFLERLYTNYAKAYKPEEILGSEPVWSGAERLSNETGMGYSEAFAQIANEFWRRQGANRYITSELAGAYIKRARSGLKLASDDELGTAISGLQGRKDLTEGSFGGNVPPSIARNIGRETMPEILARQRASEGYEAAIRDPETKKLYTGMWHEEVLDKIAKDRGIPKDQLPPNLRKGYVDYDGKFWTEQQMEAKSRSKTAMFRADDEVGAAVAAMNASEGKAPQLKPAEAAPTGNLPAVIPPQGVAAPGSAINPISNRRGFLRGARDLMAAASNANKLVTMAEKLGKSSEMPIPKHPKVPLKEIWKSGEGYTSMSDHAVGEAYDAFWEDFKKDFNKEHPQFKGYERRANAGKLSEAEETAWEEARSKFEEKHDNTLVEYEADYADGDTEGGTQFSHNQLPGATNYREHLMQMPEQEKPAHSPFYGSFDEPDIIGHTRVNDRTLKGGEKSLHVEEAGSELHETGSKQGYGKPDTSKWKVKQRNDGPFDGWWSVVDEAGNTVENVYSGPREKAIERAKGVFKEVPDLPFKSTHMDLSVNRMLHEAATQGYDALSWTPHDIQKKLYGNDSNKDFHARVEAIAKKYGGKIEKEPFGANDRYSVTRNESNDPRITHPFSVLDTDTHIAKGSFKTKAEADEFVSKQADKDGKRDNHIYTLKLTPEMKRIFGHDDFSFFPKQAAEEGPGFKLRSDSEAGAAVGALRNSGIRPIINTPEFKNWFNGSKVVNEKGEPLVVYHGTKGDFNEFDLKHARQSDEGLVGKGHYFTYNPEEASNYALNPQFGKGDAPNVRPAYVDIKKPFVIKQGVLPDGRNISELNGRPITAEGGNKIRKLAESGGHDGIVFADKNGNVRHAVVWGAKQIKHALFSDNETGTAVGALRNSGPAPTFYSGLARTLERAPFEEATPSQWSKYLRDTVGARQAEEFEHVRLADKVGKLEEEKKAVERPAQGALDAWKTANPKQRPPKELMDAASTENKRIVEQKLKDRDTDKPLTKKELMAHVGDNQPKFKEIVKKGEEGDIDAAIQRRTEEIMNEVRDQGAEGAAPGHPEYHDFFADAQSQATDELSAQVSPAKYSDYQLPGGTNYREHLMTMPLPEWKYEGKRPAAREAKMNYHSSHWDEPNVIVHTRMNDRVLSNEAPKVPTFEEWVKENYGNYYEALNKPENFPRGTVDQMKRQYETYKQNDVLPKTYAEGALKSLHAEEFQSDLHQEGRKRGYGAQDKFGVFDPEGNAQSSYRTKEMAEKAAKAQGEGWTVGPWQGQGVPDFPFKKSWPDLAIKRWLREAVDNDYDAVSWTPGEAQRDRFRLSHHLEALHYIKNIDGNYMVTGEQKGGREHAINHGLPIKEADLSRYVGEAVAEKIKKGEGAGDEADSSLKTLNNADLKVGGEGLVSFYDKTVKTKVQALVEKYGGKVEKHELPQKTGKVVSARNGQGVWNVEWNDGTFSGGYGSKAEAEKALQHRQKEETGKFVWSVKLTPELKRTIRSEGFPLFSSGLPLVPVDHDPFDKKQKPKPRLEPVEHDPFAIPTPDMGGALNKLVSEGYRPKPRPIQNGFGVRNEGAR